MIINDQLIIIKSNLSKQTKSILVKVQACIKKDNGFISMQSYHHSSADVQMYHIIELISEQEKKPIAAGTL